MCELQTTKQRDEWQIETDIHMPLHWGEETTGRSNEVTREIGEIKKIGGRSRRRNEVTKWHKEKTTQNEGSNIFSGHDLTS